MIKPLSKAMSDISKTSYNLLLVFLVLLLVFRPYNASITYLAIWKVLLTGTILAAIFNCKRSRCIQIIEIIIAIPTILFCWLDIFIPHPSIFITNTVLNILFTLLATGTIIRDVLVRNKVTIQTLKGVVCAYFLVALSFAYIFWLIEYFIPNSFFISPTHENFDYYTQYLSEMIYFSFITLLTIGYGDIVAVKNLGQTAVILEGLIGQFYVAILVARLVSAYSFSSQNKIIEKETLLDKPHDSP